MMTHRTRQYPAFDIAPLADEIFRCIAMANSLDILVDARTFVEIASDVMGR